MSSNTIVFYPKNIKLRIWKRFLRHRVAAASGFFLLLLMLMSLTAPLSQFLFGFDGEQIEITNRYAPPSLEHPFGTDELGRDLFIRLSYGGQVSLAVGLVAALFSSIIGTVIGLVAGYLGGRTDSFLMRFTDGVISLPLLPLLIVLVAIDLKKNA